MKATIVMVFWVVVLWVAICVGTRAFGSKEEVPVSVERATALIQKCYSVNLLPVIVRNDKGDVIDVFCKEKGNEQ